ncbi:MAG: ornithine carbamoyltransferase [Myxococcota bacterium]|jgi:ornithine carbamoyltransferase|nr:ornithine carbamoyltransferase [Myxococcota bacterium]
MPKDFLTVADWSAEELLGLLARARQLRSLHRAGQRPQTLQGRTLAMYFEKPSLRTHVTFEAGMAQLGGHAIVLRPDQVGIGTRESPLDVALNLSRWIDGLMARTFSHELVEQLAEYAAIPVINGLTDRLHPCQAMADLQTIADVMNPRDATLCYVGDGNNVASSLVLLAAVLGMRCRVATPSSHRIPAWVDEKAAELGAVSGAEINWFEDPEFAVEGADFIYTDTWTSMGQEEEAEERRRVFAPYQVNRQLVARAPKAWLMHCLPAHREEEITGELLDGDRSLIYEQAENRLHAQKAILERVMRPEGVE